MIFVSDIHFQINFLSTLPKNKGPVVILGDLINWIDYRNGEGIANDVFGKNNVEKLIEFRKNHKFNERKKLWKTLYLENPEEVSKKMQDALARQYELVFKSLSDYEVWLIPGNVDDSNIIENYLSNRILNVDGLMVPYNNINIGFAGGGVPTPIMARGEIQESEFEYKLNVLKDSDIICTHAPPFVEELVTDVITNKAEQGWKSLKNFIIENKPQFSLFGDVHQPKATSWIIENTKCINVGYFRATNRYLELSSFYI